MPLRNPGAQAVSTLEVLPRKAFPKWISEVQVDYLPRVPASAGKGLRSKDSAWFIIEPSLAPGNVWIGDFVAHLSSFFSPGVIAVYNQESRRLRSRGSPSEIDAELRSNVLLRLGNEYGIKIIPEMFYISQSACMKCFDADAGWICSELVKGSFVAEAKMCSDGLLMSVANQYLDPTRALVEQDNITRIFLSILKSK